jgi:ribosomal protein S18 acetylase RimI-like enzyme
VTRPIQPTDLPALRDLLRRVAAFSADEVDCALEVATGAAQPGNRDYVAQCGFVGPALAGFVVYGPTPMTHGTYDLYWIATAPEVRGTGLGSALLAGMEADLRARGARLVRAETSGTDGYEATRAFYDTRGYLETARLPDFYREGDDLVILTKRL